MISKNIHYRGRDFEVFEDGAIFRCAFLDTIGRFQRKKLAKQSHDGKYAFIGTYSPTHKLKPVRVHRLVAMAFLEDYADDLYVDHIDGNKDNNHCTNLRMVSAKENADFYWNEQGGWQRWLEDVKKPRKAASKQSGVLWDKEKSKWFVRIRINGKKKFRGYFVNEKDAIDEARSMYEEIRKQYEVGHPYSGSGKSSTS